MRHSSRADLLMCEDPLSRRDGGGGLPGSTRAWVADVALKIVQCQGLLWWTRGFFQFFHLLSRLVLDTESLSAV